MLSIFSKSRKSSGSVFDFGDGCESEKQDACGFYSMEGDGEVSVKPNYASRYKVVDTYHDDKYKSIESVVNRVTNTTKNNRY